ncbi:NAD(P)/FAD-dependent oxidoreductase [Brevibacterium album]|uniref:NAD(P)/FAD-dependent oxidoreductase n=1 Tax=Brevibacterium album TaxID=417948 RepID=UPI0004197F4C|nr:FAD-binding oxidoreductase [Brevibacterium album]
MKYDYIIIGGGVHGCAAAYHLAASGAGSIAVIETATLAAEASGGRGKRGVRANRRDLREMPLMREACELWPTLADELGADTGYVRTGGICLVSGNAANGHNGLAAVEATAGAQNALGIPTEVWDRDRILTRLPGIDTTTKAGIYAPLDGVASHGATTQAYAEAGRRLGVDFFENTTAVKIETNASGAAASVLTATEDVFTIGKQLLLANNAGANPLLADLPGGELPLWTIYPQAVFLRSRNRPEIPLLTAHDSRPLSVKVLDDGVIMLSGGWRGTLDPATGRGRTREENIAGNIRSLTETFPGLGELEVIDADASRTETASVDLIPTIGYVAPNVMVATGWSGHGWALAPAVAPRVAESLRARRADSAFAPFSPDRFTL